MWSLSECIPWMTVGLAESVAIVTLNLCTIIVFIKRRNLRKRSMYLVINLAVIDTFVGGSVVYYLFFRPGVVCNLWKELLTEERIFYFTLEVIMDLSILGSITNIAIIALERVHATFFPLRHRVLKKWVHRLIIAVVWVTSGLAVVSFQLLRAEFGEIYYAYYFSLTFDLICLLIMSVSYTSIVLKVRCGAQPQHHGEASRERKLTMTLLIVTVVSVLLYLPVVIWSYAMFISKLEIWSSIPLSVALHLESALFFLLCTNSLVNPILYAIRMPEYRSALLALFRKPPQQQRQVAVFPLREM